MGRKLLAPVLLVAVAVAAVGAAAAPGAREATRPPARLVGTLVHSSDSLMVEGQRRERYLWRREARVVLKYVRTRAGAASYRVSSGTVDVTNSGMFVRPAGEGESPNTCSWSGSGSGRLDPSASTFEVNLVRRYDGPRGTFAVRMAARKADTFTVRMDCSGGGFDPSTSTQDEDVGDFRFSGRSGSLTTLKGTGSRTAPSGTWTLKSAWSWNLKPSR